MNLKLGSLMKIYELKTELFLKTNIEIAWNYFSNPKNLDEITPSFLRFKTLSNLNGKMYGGQIITYEIALLPGFRQTWVTEIKSVEEKKCFIDEQRFGPYKFWHHKHFFEEAEGGVLMTDLVHYVMPFGLVGKFAHVLFVKKMLKNIFSFRRHFLENKFNNNIIA